MLNPQQLQQAILLLQEFQDTQTNKNAHVVVQQKLHQLSGKQGFNVYLAHILAHEGDDIPLGIKLLAGLFLKTNLKKEQDGADPQLIAFLKTCLVKGLTRDHVQIRRTSTNAICSMVRVYSLDAWPDLVPGLIEMMKAQNSSHVESGLTTIYALCDEFSIQLEKHHTKPLNLIIPVLIKFFEHPNNHFKKEALHAMTVLLQHFSNPMVANMGQFLQGLTFLANVQDDLIQRYVCRSFVILLKRPQYLEKIFPNVCEFMLLYTNSDNQVLALEACEFWGGIGETKECIGLLKPLEPYLPKLVPILLKGMVYEEYERNLLDEETYTSDRDIDIHPSMFHVTAKVIGNQEVSEEEDDEFFDAATNWNLRKCAASVIDTYSSIYTNAILPIFLKEVEKMLQPQNEWYIKESAVLAIGAVAQGCQNQMHQYLGNLVPYFFSFLKNPKEKPLLKSITCWTLSRYTRFIVTNQNFVNDMCQLLLNCLLDSNKKIREASCSAFAEFIEISYMKVIPFLPQIISALTKAFDLYRTKNVLILYDAIGTLSGVVGTKLNQPQIIQPLLPPLLKKWQEMKPGDKHLLPLLECLTCVATALKSSMKPYAFPIFQQCCNIIEKVLQTNYALEKNQQVTDEFEDKDFIVCSLDLVSGLAEALGPEMDQLIKQSNFMKLLYQCLIDKKPEVRQTSLGVVGDLAANSINSLMGFLEATMPLIIQNLDEKCPEVANNAIWALGTISVKVGPSMKSFMPAILSRLISFLNTPNLQLSVVENTAITIGRMGLVCPEVIAPQIHTFNKSWCLALRAISNDIEKVEAYKGMCLMIQANYKGILPTLPFVIDAIVEYTSPPNDLRQEFTKIISFLKKGLGDQWSSFFEQLPQETRKKFMLSYPNV